MYIFAEKEKKYLFKNIPVGCNPFSSTTFCLVSCVMKVNCIFRIPILSGISWSNLTGSTDDDWIDRVSHLWSVCLLLLFAVLVSSGQYVGDPIHCWCPAEFTGKSRRRGSLSDLRVMSHAVYAYTAIE